MPSQTNERAFEALIEKALTGSTREERAQTNTIADPSAPYSLSYGYEWGESSNYEARFAVDTEKFWRFLQATQPKQLSKLQTDPNWQRKVLDRLNKRIQQNGILHLLKKGIRVDDAELTLFYSPPVNDLNPSIAQRFQQNIFSVTRQLYYSVGAGNPSVDMVIFLNGLPIITIELKNQWTNQTVYHAKEQYKKRDINEPLFAFARCLVHFAVDTNEVEMTTRLAGRKTSFLPFNKGHRHGKGNPPNPNGHRSAYLWQEVLQPHSLANIIDHFVTLRGEKPKDPLKKKTLFFPRYHQLDVVRQLLADMRQHGVGKRYLIQHSAGSGKSNSITWLAYQLIELYRAGADTPLLNSVIVVTDRRVLDRQLSKNIGAYSEVKNIVAHAQSASDLQKHLENGKKIIISTIQKFPFVVNGIANLADHTFAVIIDEAHSSQGGKSAMKLNEALGKDTDEEPEDMQDKILQIMASRKMSQNASYFAFTATPKNSTLEKFGVPDEQGGNYRPFHLYSMKQAIEEGFILDVLANYTTYKSYYEIQKSITENPLFDTAKAQKKLRQYVEGNSATIKMKAGVMVQHFLESVITPKKLKGQAKGMVVTRNIVSAIRYYWAIKEALAERHSTVKPIVSFSGKKQVDGIEYTEEMLNGFASKDIEDKFESDEYQLLVVANKFLTGFDQPKLTTMYVDKRLQGVLAVQALSRLNRSNKKLGKRTEDLFVLDFYNTVSEIQNAFEPYYTATTLNEATDINILHDLKDALDDLGVYEWHEVEQFATMYFNNVDGDQLKTVIEPSAERFNHDLGLEDDEKADFKIKAKQFVKIYAQMSCIMPFDILTWEKLYWFLKFLIPSLVVKNQDLDQIDDLLNSVDLSTYGLERKRLNVQIELDEGTSTLDPTNPNMRGAHDPDDIQRDPLDEIIAAFNERWFTGWANTPEEARVGISKTAQRALLNKEIQSQVLNNPDEQNRLIALTHIMQSVMYEQRQQDLSLYKLYKADKDFQRTYNLAVLRWLESEQGKGGGGGKTWAVC